MANLWDGERDGLREAVKVLEAGQYDDVILSFTETAAVLYPNADGKYQIELCMQTSTPIPDDEKFPTGTHVMTFKTAAFEPEDFLDEVLAKLQKGKPQVLEFINRSFVGHGQLVDNEALYEKKGSSKSTIIVLPPEDVKGV